MTSRKTERVMFALSALTIIAGVLILLLGAFMLGRATAPEHTRPLGPQDSPHSCVPPLCQIVPDPEAS